MRSRRSDLNFFSVAKLLPIIAFIAIGAFFIDGGRFEPWPPRAGHHRREHHVIALCLCRLRGPGGAAGEMDNPKRSVPIALLIVMALVSIVYLGVLGVSIGTDGIAGHGNPVAAASEIFMGPVGGTLIAAGIVISVFGTNAGAAFVSPRRLFAMAERGDLPTGLSAVDARSGAPRNAILVTWVLAAGLCLSGSFAELAVLGVVARFLQYIPTCFAVLVFRRRDPDNTDGFRVPFGPVIPLVSIGLCVWLLSETAPKRLLMGGRPSG